MNVLTRSSLLASTSRRSAVAGAVSLQARAKHTLPELPYAYDVRSARPGYPLEFLLTLPVDCLDGA